MSAEQSRLRSAIQRIAKEDPELRGAIKAAKSRGDQPGGTGVGESDAERDQICCDGSTSDNPNPGTDERDPDSGGQDGGLNGTDPAKLDMGEGTLSGVTDCATGEPICFSGSGFIPPDGWDDPDDPPPDEDYQDGFAWCTKGTSTSSSCQGFSDLPRESADLYAAIRDDTFDNISNSTVVTFYKVTDSYYFVEIHGIVNGAGRTMEYETLRRDCSSLGAIAVDEGFACTEDAALADSWPSDGCTNLAIVNGSIVGSKYDPENDGSYSAPRDEIELCDEDGNSILIRPSADGGWKSIESLDGDIDPETGNGYLYAPDGKRIRQISPSEFRDDMV